MLFAGLLTIFALHDALHGDGLASAAVFEWVGVDAILCVFWARVREPVGCISSALCVYVACQLVCVVLRAARGVMCCAV